MATVTAKAAFSTDLNGRPFTVAGGSLWNDDDEIVKAYPDFFEVAEAPERITSVSEVEQATAAPGEKRAAKPKAKAKKD